MAVSKQYMKHYTVKQPKKKRAEEIAEVAEILLYYLQLYGISIQYKAWRKNLQDIFYLTENEYEIAKNIAEKKNNKDISEIFSHMSLRSK